MISPRKHTPDDRRPTRTDSPEDQYSAEAVSSVALADADASDVALDVGVCLRGWKYVESGIVNREIGNPVCHRGWFRPDDADHRTEPKARSMVEPWQQAVQENNARRMKKIHSSVQLPPANLTPLLFFVGSDHPDRPH